jgi:hypothetical protein
MITRFEAEHGAIAAIETNMSMLGARWLSRSSPSSVARRISMATPALITELPRPLFAGGALKEGRVIPTGPV